MGGGNPLAPSTYPHFVLCIQRYVMNYRHTYFMESCLFTIHDYRTCIPFWNVVDASIPHPRAITHDNTTVRPRLHANLVETALRHCPSDRI